jgi:hypothetical protein
MRKMPKVPKVPTLSSLKPGKRVIKAAPRKRAAVVKALPPVKELVASVEKRDKLVHLEHVEDNIINSGREGLLYSMALLKELHKRLVERKANIAITEKYDGSPSIVFGRDPQTNKFFVATKSFFSKEPKINFSEEDIENNHGYSSDLVYKLTTAFRYLPDVTPCSGVFQGDLMYVADMVKEDASFVANTVTYACRLLHTKVLVRQSALGIAVHTEYLGNDLRRLTRAKAEESVSPLYYFRSSKEVFLIPVHVPLHEVDYPTAVQEEVLSHLTTVHLSTSPNIFTDSRYAVINKYKAKLKSYINKTVRENSTPHAAEFAEYLNEPLSEELIYIFKDLFYVHGKLQRVKDILNEVLHQSNSHRPFDTYINGAKTKGEGFVVSFNGHLMKIVDRQEFSRQNFLRSTMLEKDAKITVFAYARMNPPHKGHSLLIAFAKGIAQKLEADHLIAVTSTHDKDNPLSPTKKLNYLKHFYPDTNFEQCSSHFIQELRKLYQAGTRHLIFVAGGDRKEMYETVLNDMNGKDEFFHFPLFQVVSAGERHADKEDISGMSSTKMRKYANIGDFSSFSRCAPDGNPALVRHLFEDVQRGLEE